jgi:hypothetical protein
LKETRPLWPPQRGVGLQEPNLGKTNLRVSLAYSLGICFAPSLSDSFIFLTLTRLVVVFIFVNFSFALFTPPPLGDYQRRWERHRPGRRLRRRRGPAGAAQWPADRLGRRGAGRGGAAAVAAGAGSGGRFLGREKGEE